MTEDILQKYIKGDATDDEKRSVTEWITSDEKHLKEFLTLRKLYNLMIWNEKSDAVFSRKRNLRFHLLPLMKIAALVALVFAGSWWLFSQQEEPVEMMQTIYVPAGQRTEVFLADGTKIWLNAQTTLTYPTSFASKTRSVKLDGEAYFDVAHNESAPFIVKTDKYDVKVLGTEFNVVAYKNSSYSETALLEGNVEIIIPGQTKKMMLEPNTKMNWDNGKIRKMNIQKLDYFLWREGLICFENENVKDMFRKLELYYDVKIIVENAKLLNSNYTGKFRAKDGVEHVLRVLQLNNKFTYTKDDERNLITIRD